MKKLVKSMSIYGLGGILSRSLQFLLLPVYTRFLLPADYGSLEIVYMAGSVISILYGLMIGSGYIRNYYDNKDTFYKRELLASALWFTFFVSLCFAIPMLYFAEYVADIVFDFSGGALYLRLITVYIFMAAHNQILYNLLMVRERAVRYVAINTITLAVSLLLTVYFVVFLGWSVRGILLAQIVVAALEFMMLFISMPERNIFLFSSVKVKGMLRYSIPLVPLQVAAFVLDLSDRFFLQKYQNLSEVGIYALGYKFAAILMLLSVQPLKGFTPYIFSLVDNPYKCKQTIADFYRYYLAGVLLVSLVISMFAREVIILMADKSYHDGWRVVYLLCISYVFYGSVVVISYAIEIARKNWVSGIFWVFATVINIALNFLLIPVFGIIGASIATAISYFMILICYFWAITHIYYVPFNYPKLVFIVGFTSIIYYISTFLHLNPVSSILSKSLLVVVYALILLYSGYFTKEEVFKLRRFCFSAR